MNAFLNFLVNFVFAAAFALGVNHLVKVAHGTTALLSDRHEVIYLLCAVGVALICKRLLQMEDAPAEQPQ